MEYINNHLLTNTNTPKYIYIYSLQLPKGADLPIKESHSPNHTKSKIIVDIPINSSIYSGCSHIYIYTYYIYIYMYVSWFSHWIPISSNISPISNKNHPAIPSHTAPPYAIAIPRATRSRCRNRRRDAPPLWTLLGAFFEATNIANWKDPPCLMGKSTT